MKRELKDIMVNLFNTQKTTYNLKNSSKTSKSFLAESLKALPNMETTNKLISCLKVEKTSIEKILPIPTQYSYVGIGCLENPSNTQKSFLEKIIQSLPNTETRFACGGGAAN